MPAMHTDPEHESVIEKLAKRVAAHSHIRGRFLLRSGQTSSEYFDKYQFEADPGILKDICCELSRRLPEGDVLAGLELGGIPIACVLSQETALPVCFVRKQAKQYGTCRLAEGAAVHDRRVIVVEDVVTSAGQIVESTHALRDLGANVSHAICVVDRESGGPARLREIGVQLISLFRASDLR